jgi:hypothetical protein
MVQVKRKRLHRNKREGISLAVPVKITYLDLCTSTKGKSGFCTYQNSNLELIRTDMGKCEVNHGVSGFGKESLILRLIYQYHCFVKSMSFLA